MNIINSDCIEGMRTLPEASVDAIVTDPPYELGFMGKAWDASGIANSVEMWTEALRVLKPGGHLLAFSGSRTYHRMVCAIEDAGFEIRDQIMWVYGSGFPKSLNVATAVDEARKPDTRLELLPDEMKFCAWVRDQSGLDAETVFAVTGSARFFTGEVEIVNTATKQRPRYGRRAMVPTADAWLKLRESMTSQPPEWVEDLIKDPPKPGIDHPGQWKEGKGEGTAGSNEWAGWGTALKPAHEPIVVARKPLIGTVAANVLAHGTGALNIDGCRVAAPGVDLGRNNNARTTGTSYVVQKEAMRIDNSGGLGRWPANLVHDGSDEVLAAFPDSNGSAARFFYAAKASKADRGEGNTHPTVKPTDLMRYLCRLVTPPGGLVMDPFTGSGSTAKAAFLEGFQFVGFELSAEYAAIARGRVFPKLPPLPVIPSR